jgi:hypothetical protein
MTGMHLAKKPFLLFCGMLLIATSLMKFVYFGGDHRILLYPDPVISFLKNRDLLLISALVELFIGILIFSEKRNSLGLLATAWFSTIIITYRIAHYFSGSKAPCSCLGNIWDYTHLTARHAEWIAWGISVVMLLGSYTLLIIEMRNRTVPNEPQTNLRQQ